MLKTGFKPSGDDVQGLMAEMIDNGFKHLSDDDLRAIAVYLRSLPPVRNEVPHRNGEEAGNISEGKASGMKSENGQD